MISYLILTAQTNSRSSTWRETTNLPMCCTTVFHSEVAKIASNFKLDFSHYTFHLGE